MAKKQAKCRQCRPKVRAEKEAEEPAAGDAHVEQWGETLVAVDDHTEAEK